MACNWRWPATSKCSALTMPGGAGVAPLTGLADLVRAVAWSPDGSIVAVGGGTPGAFGEIVLFDAATGAERARLEGHRDYVYHLAFNHDGARLASCGYDKVDPAVGHGDGQTIGVLKEHTEAVYAVAFSGDGTLLASAAADRSVKIWKVADGVRLYTITEPTDAVLTLAFRPGTRQLAAGGQDKRIRVWEIGDTAARSIRSAPAHRSAVLRVAFSADGRTLASTGADKDVKMWDADTASRSGCCRRRVTGRKRSPSAPTAASWPWVATMAASASTRRRLAGPCSNRSATTRWHDDEDSDTRSRSACSDDRRVVRFRAGRRADAAGRGHQPHALRHPARDHREFHRRRRESDGRRPGDLHGPRSVGADRQGTRISARTSAYDRPERPARSSRIARKRGG